MVNEFHVINSQLIGIKLDADLGFALAEALFIEASNGFVPILIKTLNKHFTTIEMMQNYRFDGTEFQLLPYISLQGKQKKFRNSKKDGIWVFKDIVPTPIGTKFHLPPQLQFWGAHDEKYSGINKESYNWRVIDRRMQGILIPRDYNYMKFPPVNITGDYNDPFSAFYAKQSDMSLRDFVENKFATSLNVKYWLEMPDREKAINLLMHFLVCYYLMEPYESQEDANKYNNYFLENEIVNNPNAGEANIYQY